MSDILIKLAAVLAIACAGFLAGWQTNGWRMGTQVQQLKAEHEKTVADAAQASNQRLITVVNERDALAERLAAIDKTYTSQLTKAKNENQALAARIAAGTVGLRIDATCPATDSGSAKVPESSGVDFGTFAVLNPDARLAYQALRAGIVATEATLTACQKSLAEFSN